MPVASGGHDVTREVAHVERAPDLALREAARTVEVDVLKGLEHVGEARVEALFCHREDLFELLLLPELFLDIALGRWRWQRRRNGSWRHVSYGGQHRSGRNGC